MATLATNSKRKRSSGETADKSSRSKKAKLKALLFSAPTEMVTFLVDNDAEPFSVHKEFACHISPVLKAAFNSEFVEGQTKTYRLKDIEPSVFRLFVEYLYSEQVELQIMTQAEERERNIDVDEYDRSHAPTASSICTSKKWVG